ncbi:hypothetical protein UY456_23035 [Paenibacillus polymyxa]|uniref:hypothetical protein n=1 Tax=Paenibacillus polymyxa TaxID=1406 RepID=UPI002AB4B973|nr:hypothetical protein [Paenibacillus polymyxa]MDY8095846.1 hypothetical protein [Paenibacillus polymyxa]
MTDKHYVDAEKLLEWAKVGLGSAKLYTKLVGEIESGRIDPDPPQQPDIQVGKRNWQEDMNLCQKATVGPWMGFDDIDGHCIGTKDIHPQLKAHAPVVTLATSIHGKSIYISQNDSNFIIAAREALPYWLQQAKFEKERAMGNYNWAKYEEGRADKATERHEAASRDRDAVYKKLEEAESLIQQKDAEIAELKRLAEFWESQYSDASTHGDETEELLNAEINRLNSLLQDKGNTP